MDSSRYHWEKEWCYSEKDMGGFKTKTEALNFCPTLIDQHPIESKTFKYYYDMWAASDLLGLSKSKQKAYKGARKRLDPIIDFSVGETDIKTLRDIVREEGSSFYVARDMKNLLSHLYKYAMAEKQSTVNLSRFIALPELVESEPVPFTEEELSKIWIAYDKGDRIAAYLLLLVYSGMMPGEMFECEKDKIDLEKQIIVGAGMKTKERKKTPIVIADIIVPVVQKILTFTTDKHGQKIVFTNQWAFYDLYRLFKTDHGIRDLPLYTCRHTTATALAIGTNVAPAIIQKIMRHAKFSTTERYIHPDTRDALEGVNAIKLPRKIEADEEENEE
jgi:integrase